MAWARTSRHARGYGSGWVKLRASILARDCYLCTACQAKGIAIQATEVDHIKPKAKGGTDAADNLASLCHPCHTAKTAQDNGQTLRSRITTGVDGWPIARP